MINNLRCINFSLKVFATSADKLPILPPISLVGKEKAVCKVIPPIKNAAFPEKAVSNTLMESF